MNKTLLSIVFAVVIIALPGFSEAPATVKPSFEVATIKPGPTGQNFVVIGGPTWITSDRWNVEGQAEAGSVPPRVGPPDPTVPDTIALMVQSLIEDRFQLKYLRETREQNVYTLTVGNDGPKMKSVDPPPRFTPGQAAALPPPPPPPPPGPGGALPANFTPPPGSIMVSPSGLIGSGISMTQIVNILSGQLGRPVVDKTELKGYFDVRLQFAPEGGGPMTPFGPGEPAPGPAVAGASEPVGPSIFTAVQEQLGLRLESTKGPVDVLLIESVQKPTGELTARPKSGHLLMQRVWLGY